MQNFRGLFSSYSGTTVLPATIRKKGSPGKIPGLPLFHQLADRSENLVTGINDLCLDKEFLQD